MANDGKIRDKKLQHIINRKAAKKSVLSSEKVYKHKHLAGKEILHNDQCKMIEQAIFTYSLLGKPLEK